MEVPTWHSFFFLLVKRIPKSFVKKYEKHLSNLVHLKLPSGSEWEVEVTTCDCEVWLDKGWPEFSKFYSLEQGGSLVFKYDGNSKFHVCILDASGTEIDYPLVLPVMEETDEDDENNSVEILEDYDDENDNSAEIFGDYQPCPKTRQNSGPLSRPLPRKKNRLSTHSSPEISSSSSKRVVEATNKFISNPSFRVTVGSSLMPVRLIDNIYITTFCSNGNHLHYIIHPYIYFKVTVLIATHVFYAAYTS